MARKFLPALASLKAALLSTLRQMFTVGSALPLPSRFSLLSRKRFHCIAAFNSDQNALARLYSKATRSGKSRMSLSLQPCVA